MNLLQLIKTRLTEIADSVDGVKRSYSQSPMTLPNADLPAIVCFTGPVLSSVRLSDSLMEETRKFILRLYVTSIQSGYDGDAERKVEPFFTSVRDTFLKHPGLGLGTSGSALRFVEKMAWAGDGGVMVLPFAGDQYLGTEFNLSVKSILPIALSDYE